MADQGQEEGLGLPRQRCQLTELLVTDLDGTLLTSDGEVHEQDRRAIAALLERGVVVSVCTGRMYSGTRHIAQSLSLSGPIGCLDGSHIVDAATDEHLARHPLSDFARDVLLSALERHAPVSFLFSGDEIIHDDRGEPFLPYVRQWSARARRLPRLTDKQTWHSIQGVAAVVSVGDQAQIERTAKELSAESGLSSITFPVGREGFRGTWGMVARAAGVSKATAVEWLARYHGVSLEDVVAVGDWLNDVPMLRAVGRSYAMAQAPESVKSAAKHVLDADAWSGGGIAEAAERAGLL